MGVPVTVQSLLSVRPAGGVPAASAHVCGGRPPLGWHALEYGTSTSPLASVQAPDNGPRFTTACSGRRPVAPSASVTPIVTSPIPGRLGTPAITPVVGFRVRPV